MDLNSLQPEQIKGLISLLQELLPKETEQEEPITAPTQKKSKKSQSKFVNKFDSMSEFRMHKEDRAVDEKLAQMPPVPRTRKFVPVSVVCRVCGRKESVNPALIDSIERYKCNKCCSSGA